MAVLDPIKLVITNYPEDQFEDMYSENNPEVEGGDGGRNIPFSANFGLSAMTLWKTAKEILPWCRLMVRLKSAYIVKCEYFEKDAEGNVTEIHCTYFLNQNRVMIPAVFM